MDEGEGPQGAAPQQHLHTLVQLPAVGQWHPLPVSRLDEQALVSVVTPPRWYCWARGDSVGF